MIKLSENEFEILAKQMKQKVERMQMYNASELKLNTKKVKMEQVPNAHYAD